MYSIQSIQSDVALPSRRRGPCARRLIGLPQAATTASHNHHLMAWEERTRTRWMLRDSCYRHFVASCGHDIASWSADYGRTLLMKVPPASLCILPFTPLIASFGRRYRPHSLVAPVLKEEKPEVVFGSCWQSQTRSYPSLPTRLSHSAPVP